MQNQTHTGLNDGDCRHDIEVSSEDYTDGTCATILRGTIGDGVAADCNAVAVPGLAEVETVLYVDDETVRLTHFESECEADPTDKFQTTKAGNALFQVPQAHLREFGGGRP